MNRGEMLAEGNPWSGFGQEPLSHCLHREVYGSSHTLLRERYSFLQPLVQIYVVHYLLGNVPRWTHGMFDTSVELYFMQSASFIPGAGAGLAFHPLSFNGVT